MGRTGLEALTRLRVRGDSFMADWVAKVHLCHLAYQNSAPYLNLNIAHLGH